MAANNHLSSTPSAVPSLLRQFPTSPSLFPSPLAPIRKSRLSSSTTKLAASRMMEYTDFPRASAPVKDLMLDLVNSVEARIGSSLLPCSLPPDVKYFQNPTCTAEGSLLVRSGIPSSPVDFIWGSWVHYKLPSGGALNITSLSTYLKSLTDAPNFVIDIIQSSPTSLLAILDMPPRKDLVLNPEYLKTFYEDTELDRHRQLLEKLPGVTLYISPSLYMRTLVSPTAILVRIEEAEADKATRIEEIIRDHLRPSANQIMKIWLDLCASVGREVEEAEIAYLTKRDQATRRKSIEIDLGPSLLEWFGEEVADRVLQALRETFNV